MAPLCGCQNAFGITFLKPFVVPGESYGMEEEYYDQLGRYGNDLKEDDGANCQSGDQEVFMEEKIKRT